MCKVQTYIAEKWNDLHGNKWRETMGTLIYTDSECPSFTDFFCNVDSVSVPQMLSLFFPRSFLLFFTPCLEKKSWWKEDLIA